MSTEIGREPSESVLALKPKAEPKKEKPKKVNLKGRSVKSKKVKK